MKTQKFSKHSNQTSKTIHQFLKKLILSRKRSTSKLWKSWKSQNNTEKMSFYRIWRVWYSRQIWTFRCVNKGR